MANLFLLLCLDLFVWCGLQLSSASDQACSDEVLGLAGASAYCYHENNKSNGKKTVKRYFHLEQSYFDYF